MAAGGWQYLQWPRFFKGHSIRIHQAQAQNSLFFFLSGSSWWDRAVAFRVPTISRDHDAASLLPHEREASQIPFFHTS